MSRQVKCLSGIMGTRIKLRENYDGSFEQFQHFSEIYNISGRLGYKTPEEAWQDNPTIEISVNPSDLRKVL